MFLTNVQHLFCNSSTGTKTVFPHKIYLPKGDLPLENEIAVAMSKAFGHRKRKYYKHVVTYVHTKTFSILLKDGNISRTAFVWTIIPL